MSEQIRDRDQNQQIKADVDPREDRSFDDAIELEGIQKLLKNNAKATERVQGKIEQAKAEFRGSVAQVDQKYKDKLKALQVSLDEHHEKQFQQLNAHKAQIDGEIK